MKNVVCVKCGSENLRKNGIKKDGRQRYKCKDCGREFAEKLVKTPKVKKVKKVEKVACIKCGSMNIKRNGKTSEGKQRYICKDCGLTSVMDMETTTIFNKEKIPKDLYCPVCGGIDLALSGHSALGKQQYRCKECGRKFVENPIVSLPLSVEEKRVIILYYFNFGVRITDLAAHLKRSHSTISSFIRKYKEKGYDGKLQLQDSKGFSKFGNISL